MGQGNWQCETLETRVHVVWQRLMKCVPCQNRVVFLLLLLNHFHRALTFGWFFYQHWLTLQSLSGLSVALNRWHPVEWCRVLDQNKQVELQMTLCPGLLSYPMLWPWETDDRCADWLMLLLVLHLCIVVSKPGFCVWIELIDRPLTDRGDLILQLVRLRVRSSWSMILTAAKDSRVPRLALSFVELESNSFPSAHRLLLLSRLWSN